MEPFGRYAAENEEGEGPMHEHMEGSRVERAEHEMMMGEMPCSVCGQPANQPIPPGQSVRAQALGYAVQVREYPLAPERVPETINPNKHSNGV